ncbi:MAG: stage III sporulation protein AB [Clostridiales bacterium]|jgi:stage III sporulation protein AB|nr:stage III sporulation protein AB [Clostridiales bacterium]
MLSLIAGAFLFIGCLYGGAGIKHYYKVRAEYFEEINNLCNMLIDEITHLKTPLIKIFENFTYMKKDEFSKHINAFSELLRREVIAERASLLAITDTVYLKKEERTIIADFLSLLGKSHSESQVINIKHYKNKFEEISLKAKEAYKVQGTLAYKLGILLGIALMIITI